MAKRKVSGSSSNGGPWTVEKHLKRTPEDKPRIFTGVKAVLRYNEGISMGEYRSLKAMFEENGGTVHEGMGPESTHFVSSKWRSACKEFAAFRRWSYYPVHKRCVSWDWLRACQLATIQVGCASI
jgi:hypothetical protein